jgi:hypothetical protein
MSHTVMRGERLKSTEKENAGERHITTYHHINHLNILRKTMRYLTQVTTLTTEVV